MKKIIEIYKYCEKNNKKTIFEKIIKFYNHIFNYNIKNNQTFLSNVYLKGDSYLVSSIWRGRFFPKINAYVSSYRQTVLGDAFYQEKKLYY